MSAPRTLDDVLAGFRAAGLEPAKQSGQMLWLVTCPKCHADDALQVIPTPESADPVRLWCDHCKGLRLSDVPTAAKPKLRQALPPTLDPRALHGPVGRYVRIVAPHTEASAPPILLAILAGVGALIGRGPTWIFGQTDHHALLFVLIVGATGSARKGTALSIMRRLLRELDEDFARERIASGLSSAEGLIAEVRDATPERVDARTGKPVPGDPGVLDKRLLVIEAEFASPLEVMRRDGNRLSPVLRDVWDGQSLRTMTKADPQRATAPHIAMVAAITPDELNKRLGSTAVLNGLANRFLPVWSSRSQLLPLDSTPDPRELEAATRDIRHAVDAARRIGYVDWTPAAEARWCDVYPSLAIPDSPDGTLRALLERGAPQVRRVAMLYALLDSTAAVDVCHLEAALAVWRYSADSWRMVYAEADHRSPLAARLLAAIEEAGSAGLSRTALHSASGSKGTPLEALNKAIGELAASGAVQSEKLQTRGRSVEVWRHARHVGGDIPDTAEARIMGSMGIAALVPAIPIIQTDDDAALFPAIPIIQTDDDYLDRIAADGPPLDDEYADAV